MRLPLLLLTCVLLFSAAPARAQQGPPAAPPPPPTSGVAGFKLVVEPDSVTVRRGSTARVTVRVVAEAGFKARIELLSSLLYDTTMTFDPPAVDAGSGRSVLTIAPGHSALKGAYVTTITGIGAGVSQMATLRVKVR